MRRRLAFLLAFAGLTIAALAPGIGISGVLAADPNCAALLGGNDGSGTCVVSAPIGVTGTITLNEGVHLQAGAVLTVTTSLTLNVNAGDLEMDAGSAINAPGLDVTIKVPNGNMTMHGPTPGGPPGAQIVTTKTGSGGVAGNVTIDVGNYPNTPPSGIFTMETGSLIEANNNSSGVGGDIKITAGKSGNIDGQVLSQVTAGSSGNGGRDGGLIFVDTGCGLTISQTGLLSSLGQDDGADLVHLSSCEVTIAGKVESTGGGHGTPTNPANSCAHTFRSDKPDNSTACIEVWADNITITSTGEVNADLNNSGNGGPQGTSWVDLFANTNISITGRTGLQDTFSVHADTYENEDHSPNTITAKAINGTLTASGRAFSAFGNQGGASDGGSITAQANNNVNLDTATLFAQGRIVGTTGNGGQIAVKSFNGSVSWKNGVGDDRLVASGTIDISACTSVDVTGTNFNGETVVPVVPNTCTGKPTVASYVVFQKDIWDACRNQTTSTTTATTRTTTATTSTTTARTTITTTSTTTPTTTTTTATTTTTGPCQDVVIETIPVVTVTETQTATQTQLTTVTQTAQTGTTVTAPAVTSTVTQTIPTCTTTTQTTFTTATTTVTTTATTNTTSTLTTATTPSTTITTTRTTTTVCPTTTATTTAAVGQILPQVISQTATTTATQTVTNTTSTTLTVTAPAVTSTATSVVGTCTTTTTTPSTSTTTIATLPSTSTTTTPTTSTTTSTTSTTTATTPSTTTTTSTTSPTGTVAGATSPPKVTLPPTDTTPGSPSNGAGGNAAFILLSMVGVIAFVLIALKASQSSRPAGRRR